MSEPGEEIEVPDDVAGLLEYEELNPEPHLGPGEEPPNLIDPTISTGEHDSDELGEAGGTTVEDP